MEDLPEIPDISHTQNSSHQPIQEPVLEHSFSTTCSDPSEDEEEISESAIPLFSGNLFLLFIQYRNEFTQKNWKKTNTGS